jgi:hypothetical protein
MTLPNMAMKLTGERCGPGSRAAIDWRRHRPVAHRRAAEVTSLSRDLVGLSREVLQAFDELKAADSGAFVAG